MRRRRRWMRLRRVLIVILTEMLLTPRTFGPLFFFRECCCLFPCDIFKIIIIERRVTLNIKRVYDSLFSVHIYSTKYGTNKICFQTIFTMSLNAGHDLDCLTTCSTADNSALYDSSGANDHSELFLPLNCDHHLNIETLLTAIPTTCRSSISGQRFVRSCLTPYFA